MNQQQESELSFEEALTRLEGIVSQLESGGLALEQSLAYFEEGMRLQKICADKLGEAEKKIEVLVKKADGDYAWENRGKKGAGSDDLDRESR
ncbi:MAG: exodeoxyribonuclease VII small subunit [Lentisphaeria bacterium]|jgi:exodeoxyribonuclease VII small subunit